MAQFQINIHRKGLRQLFLEKAMREKFPDCIVTVSAHNPPTTRAERFAEAEGQFENAKSTISELKDELEAWHGSLPENLQNGDKANTLQESIDSLDNLTSELEGVSFDAPEFPSMMG